MNIVLFNFHDVILLYTIFQCLLLLIFFSFLSQQPVLSRCLMAGFLLASAAIPIDILISFGEAFRPYAIQNLPNLFYVFEIGFWLGGPFLLWYVRSLTQKNFRLRMADVSYLLPFFFYLLHQILVYHSLSTESKIALQEKYSFLQESYTVIYIVFAREGLRFYVAMMAAMELKKYISAHKGEGSLHIEFLWLKILVWGITTLWGVAMLLALSLVLNLIDNFHIPVREIGLSINYFTCFLLGAVIIALSKKNTQPALCESDTLQPKIVKEKHPEYARDAEKLEKLMLEKKLYLDPNLTPELLAGHMGMSARLLSSVINQQHECNFFIYVNRYRIHEAKILLASPAHKSTSILDIMYQVGFNSKATFNATFKKLEDSTPREYRKKHLGDLPEEFL